MHASLQVHCVQCTERLGAGIMDNELTSGQRGREELIGALERLRNAAVSENVAQAAAVGITPAAAVTCVKPSGTVSQLVDAASGIHPRHSRYYVRRVRGNAADPLSRFLADSGVPNEPCAYSPGSQVRSCDPPAC
jgi:ribonucleoside-triphosphate reductase (thioredoxin)